MSSSTLDIKEVNEDVGISGCAAIDYLIESSKTYDNGEPIAERWHLKWISYSKITDITDIDIEPALIDQTVYYATYNRPDHKPEMIMLLSFENNDNHVQEFIANIYSIPAHVHANTDGFKRYSTLLVKRNNSIIGFTRDDDKYFLVAKRQFYQYYSLYGFCSACGKLRCSPVWCICGHKQLSNGWTSADKKLDEFIKNSQKESKTANEAYLEWIPFELLRIRSSDGENYFNENCSSIDKSNLQKRSYAFLNSIPVYKKVELISLEGLHEADDSYYQRLSKDYPEILDRSVWSIIGFTYHTEWRKYAIVKLRKSYKENAFSDKLCLACVDYLHPNVDKFCLDCKAPIPLDWTTGNKSLDSFIMKSWQSRVHKHDSYLQWIEFSQLANIQETPSLERGCTHTADLQGVTTSNDKEEVVKVMLRMIVSGDEAQSFDFNQLLKEYPKILSPDNFWIIGITQKPSTGDYFLIFYTTIRSVLDQIMKAIKIERPDYKLNWIPFEHLDNLQEIGSGAYGTVYSATWMNSKSQSKHKRVVLKCLKNFSQTLDSFISEVKNHITCSPVGFFLNFYGISQRPDTDEYIVVMQHADKGNLLSYLHHNVNNLTWRQKIEQLLNISFNLIAIHNAGLVHCDLHGGNIVVNAEQKAGADYTRSYICDLGLSQPTNTVSKSTVLSGVLPYMAPEIFYTRKYTQASDIYAFGIIMYQIASGDPPFRDRASDKCLALHILNGLRPEMPESTPDVYRKLAERCCDGNPDQRPSIQEVYKLLKDCSREADRDKSSNNVWNSIYYNANSKPVSRIEKENKYSSKRLPTINLAELRHSKSTTIDFMATRKLTQDSNQVNLVLPDL